MDYTSFEKYPLEILGINESYNDELTAIEELVIEEIAYTGTASDIESVLPYFVYFKFCENRETEVMHNSGESYKVQEYSNRSVLSQVRAWNLGAKKLDAICVEKETEANEIYRSQRSLL